MLKVQGVIFMSFIKFFKSTVFLLIFASTYLFSADDQCLQNKADATSFGLNDSKNGVWLESIPSKDVYFKFILSQKGRLTINSYDASITTRAVLYDSGCNEIANDNIDGATKTFSIDKILNSGTYYLRVYNRAGVDSGDRSGPFSIENSFTKSKNEREITVEKNGVSKIAPSSEITYTVRVRNVGSENPTKLTITDSLIDNGSYLEYKRFDGNGWSCNKSSNSVECSKNNPSKDESLRLVYQSICSVDSETIVKSRVSAKAFYDSTNIQKSVDKSLTIEKAEPNLNLSNWAPENSAEGNYLTYFINVENSGNTELTDVVVRGNIPSGFKFEEFDIDSSWSCSDPDSGGDFICNLNKSLDSSEIQVKLQVTAGSGKLKLSSRVEAKSCSKDKIEKSAQREVTIARSNPQVDIKKSVKDNKREVLRGEEFTYLIEVSAKDSNVPLRNLEVSDTLPIEVVFVSANGEDWSCSGSGRVVCKRAYLHYGESSTIEIKVQAKSEKKGVTNMAKVTTDEGVSDNDEVSIDIRKPNLKVDFTKSAPATVKPLEEFSYTFEVTNSGEADLNNIRLEDIINSNLTLPDNWDEGVKNGWECSKESQRVNCNYKNSLEVGERTSFYINVIAPYSESEVIIPNSAVVTIDDGSRFEDNTTTTIPQVVSNVSIVKTSDRDKVTKGKEFNYIIYVKNEAVKIERDFKLVDIISDELEIVDINQTNARCNRDGRKVECDFDLNVSGDSDRDFAKIVIGVKAPNDIDTTHVVRNIASLKNENIDKNASTDVTLVSLSDALSFSVSAKPRVYTNENFNYKVRIINNSGEDIDSVEIANVLPEGVAYRDSLSDDWSCEHFQDGLIKCQNGDEVFKKDEEKTLEFMVKAPLTSGEIVDIAYLRTSLDSRERNSSIKTEVTDRFAELGFHRFSSDKDKVLIGEKFTYTISASNIGKYPSSDIAAKGVKMEIELDNELQYDSFEVDGNWSCGYDSGEHKVVCTLDTLPFGENSEDIKITVFGLKETQTKTRVVLSAENMKNDKTKEVYMDVDIIKEGYVNLDIDISDTEDPVEPQEEYEYKVVVKNGSETDSVVSLKVDINTTSSTTFEYLGFESEDSDWECGLKSGGILCKFKKDEGLAPSQESSFNIKVKAPDIIGSVEKIDVRAIAYSKFIYDKEDKNNIDIEETTVSKIDLSLNKPRDFTKVALSKDEYDLNIFGDMLTIGNQVLCEQNRAGECITPTRKYNDLVNQSYVNLDPIAKNRGFKNSSKAQLVVESSDEIVWAGLYWFGRIKKDGNQDTLARRLKSAKHVYIRAESDSNYHRVNAQEAAKAYDNDGNAITVNKFNYIIDNSYINYQGVSDVTEYVKRYSGYSGKTDEWFWVADVESSEGYNMSAGWALVVIVQDIKDEPTRELKNITIFDGFKGIWVAEYYNNGTRVDKNLYPTSVTQTVKGFLTPRNGEIRSKLIFLGLEGDDGLGDYIKVNGKYLSNNLNSTKDVVNGTISRDGVLVTNRVPNIDPTFGVDIDEFDIGDRGMFGLPSFISGGYINHGDSEATIEIGSVETQDGQEQFYLGMFGFSTQLREPVCYIQRLKNSDFTSDLDTENVYLGDKIGVEVMFKNRESQTLQNFRTYSRVSNLFIDINDSFEAKNVGEVSFTPHQELFEFDKVPFEDGNITEAKTYLGVGANGTRGGEFSYEDQAYIRYNAIVANLPENEEDRDDNSSFVTDPDNDQNRTAKVGNRYYVSYAPYPNKKIQIKRCDGVDENITITPNKTNGFDSVHVGGLSDGKNDGKDSSGNPSNENHLFTQISDMNFSVDVVAMDDTDRDRERIRDSRNSYTGLIRVDVVDYNETLAGIPGYGNICANQQAVTAPIYVALDGQNIKTLSLKVPKALKDARVRVRYLVDRYNRHVWDKANVSVGEDIYALRDALRGLEEAYSYYEDDRCKQECMQGDIDLCRECLFKDRVLSGGFSRSSCSTDLFAVRPKKIDMSVNGLTILLGGKDYNLTLDANVSGYDNTITSVNGRLDYNLTKAANCPTDHKSGTLLGSSDKIKFNKDGNATFNGFSYPDIGEINVTVVDRNWTIFDQDSSSSYMSDCIIGSSSNTPNSSGKVGCDIQGMEKFRFSPKSFKNSYVEFKDFKNSFTYMSNDDGMYAPYKFDIEAILEDGNVSKNFDSGCYATDVNFTITVNGLSDPKLFDVNATQKIGGSNDKFIVGEGNFSNGKATVTVGINEGRVTNTPKNPMIVNSKDINISVDDNGTYGISSVGVTAVADKNISLYYGRAHVPDIETNQNSIKIPIEYEIYCNGCDKSRFTLANSAESEDSVDWYIINSKHNSSSQGKITGVTSQNGCSVSVDTTGYKEINATLTATAPHRDRITYKPSPWLVYDKFKSHADSESFNIYFSSSSDKWEGRGSIGEVIDQNISTKTNSKMEW
jgi:uncharacterized repeat protein (TIGR01451 family)